MARARNLKPGFYKNEDLAECSFAARLCFAGLWLLADREGRLEDRPKRIKGELFAFDNIDVETLLMELARYGFIQRYEAGGLRLIQVLKFSDHQNPHHREPPSDLPPPSSPGLDPIGNTQKPRADDGCNDPKAQGKPEASPGIEVHDATSHVASSQLIPDSGFLIPDSLPLGLESEALGSTMEVKFDGFWAAYPRKVGKDAARKAFAKRKPSDALLTAMLEAIERQRDSFAWRKEGGQFIPHPSTWLSEGRWQDEAESAPQRREVAL